MPLFSVRLGLGVGLEKGGISPIFIGRAAKDYAI